MKPPTHSGREAEAKKQGGPATLESLFQDVLDLIDESVADITDSEVDARLQAVFGAVVDRSVPDHVDNTEQRPCVDFISAAAGSASRDDKSSPIL
jgi:hypothetical protein